MKSLIKWLVVAAVLAVMIVVAWRYFHRDSAQAVSYRTTAVTRGDLLVSIAATGTVEPEEVVDVGAQIAGRIMYFGKDANGKAIDYSSPVEEGTVLAKIDDSLYAAEVAQDVASVDSGKAGLQRAVADLVQMKAKLVQADRDWQRRQKLGPSEALAQSSYDAYESAYETAKANVAVDEAAILQAKAAVAQADAVLQKAQRNLSYCTIVSPVKGVIIDRRVNIGQTVVASLNAPSLFLIAKDLNRMQVWVAVNEADVGRIHVGQPVSFYVDAFPGETFQGVVGKIRLNAAMTQNVVTYTVEIITDNSNGRLMPYLTANIQFELDRLHQVLLAPNAALRWQPQTEQIAPEFRQAAADKGEKAADKGEKAAARGGAVASSQPASSPASEPSTAPATAPARQTHHAVLWVEDGAYVKPIRVRAGLTDGIMTEVEGEGLTEGLQIVVGQRAAGAAPEAETSNPFAPRLPGRPAGGGAGGARGGAAGAGGAPGAGGGAGGPPR